ncbi:MAG: IS1096 element passenger TnpR family protein [Streptosporangiaceae bacterium]
MEDAEARTAADELREAARLAGECAVLERAVALARWTGTGSRPVTARQVLRQPDVPAAAAALGVRLPERLRSAADLPELHRPWCVAIATGLLRVAGGTVTCGPALEGWPPGDAGLLTGWLAGLLAVCEASGTRAEEGDGLLVLVLALLTVLQDDDVPAGRELWDAVLDEADDLCDVHDLDLDVAPAAFALRAGRERGNPLGGLVTLLADFGALAAKLAAPDAPAAPVITPLGRWAARQLAEALPGAADPEISAAELIAEMAESAGEAERWEAASEWLDARDPEDAVRELLEAAESMSPRLRTVAVSLAEMLDGDGLPAWRELAKAPCVGPHARAVLHAWDQGPEPDQADWQWLGAESAAAALEESGPDEALCRIWESVRGDGLDARLAAVRATGHPGAEKLARAVAGFVASGAPRSIDQGVQLKVTLKYSRPPIWRSVQLPVIASLADLHTVIQVMFGWDGDHLHAFTVGGRQYSDPSFELELAADEDEMRVRDAFPPGGKKAGYEYDFGASWIHEITRQKAFRLDPEQVYPVCVAFSGDSPIEYPYEEDPQEPEPFGPTEVNRKLAKLGGG